MVQSGGGTTDPIHSNSTFVGTADNRIITIFADKVLPNNNHSVTELVCETTTTANNNNHNTNNPIIVNDTTIPVLDEPSECFFN